MDLLLPESEHLSLNSDTFNGKEVWHSKLVAKTTGMAEAFLRY